MYGLFVFPQTYAAGALRELIRIKQTSQKAAGVNS